MINRGNNTNYKKDEIEIYLNKIHILIKEHNYVLSNRDKNNEMELRYMLTNKDRISDILLSVTSEDFCYTRQNNNQNFGKAILYVFSIERTLYDNNGDAKSVNIYIKFNLIENATKKLIVISFHELERPIDKIEYTEN